MDERLRIGERDLDPALVAADRRHAVRRLGPAAAPRAFDDGDDAELGKGLVVHAATIPRARDS